MHQLSHLRSLLDYVETNATAAVALQTAYPTPENTKLATRWSDWAEALREVMGLERREEP